MFLLNELLQDEMDIFSLKKKELERMLVECAYYIYRLLLVAVNF